MKEQGCQTPRANLSPLIPSRLRPSSRIQEEVMEEEVIREAEEELEEEERRLEEQRSRMSHLSDVEDLSDIELDMIGDFMVKESLDTAAGRGSASPRARAQSRQSIVGLLIHSFMVKFLCL